MKEIERYQDVSEVEVLDAEPNATSREWQAIRDECIAGESIEDPRCNLIGAIHFGAKVEVVAKRLSCGCILVPADAEEIIL